MMKKRGFTLIELLVVIAIIAVLMGILMPALQRVKEQARQQTCGTRVRQQVLGLLMYADDNNTKMPEITAGGWLQDIPVPAVNTMLTTGMTKEMFYCPSNETHKQFMDYCWYFGVTDNSGDEKEWKRYWDGKKFINFGNTDYIVAGYFFLLSGRSSSISTYNRLNEDEKSWVSSTQNKRPASKELVTDLTYGDDDSDMKYEINFGMVSTGGLMTHGIYDRTSHLKSDEEPRGWNVGFLDGHIEWRHWNPGDSGDANPYWTGKGNKPLPRWDASGPACFW